MRSLKGWYFLIEEGMIWIFKNGFLKLSLERDKRDYFEDAKGFMDG